jgi:biopolymer transport protein ExbB/TolQ
LSDGREAEIGMIATQAYMRDRAGKLALLVGIAIVTHLAYQMVVLPRAAAWETAQLELVRSQPGYKPQRSFFSIIKDNEQKVTIIIAAWAAILAFMQFADTRKQRRLLEADLLRLPPGVVILPEDAQEYSRRLDQLPVKERDFVAPRVLRGALKRFGTTRNVQDVSTTIHDTCESEMARLDSELAMLRFSVWATPALGFIGTVRGIGVALQGAELAMKGDTSAVTGGLGVSFNSTLIALTLCLFLMYLLHEIQLAQERLVLDTERYADEQLVARLSSR